jgi:hypothetical protein
MRDDTKVKEEVVVAVIPTESPGFLAPAVASNILAKKKSKLTLSDLPAAFLSRFKRQVTPLLYEFLGCQQDPWYQCTAKDIVGLWKRVFSGAEGDAIEKETALARLVETLVSRSVHTERMS